VKKTVVTAPEQSLNAAQTLEMLNDSGQALLPARLVPGRRVFGMTNLDSSRTGSNAVFLSVADQLKIPERSTREQCAGRKQRTQMQLAFVVTVENLSSKSMSLKLADRIPVSGQGRRSAGKVGPPDPRAPALALTCSRKRSASSDPVSNQYPPTWCWR
jgi:hypothetical protein